MIRPPNIQKEIQKIKRQRGGAQREWGARDGRRRTHGGAGGMRKTSERHVDGRDERDREERRQRRSLLDGCRGHRPLRTCRPACILCVGPLPVRAMLSMRLGGVLPVLAV